MATILDNLIENIKMQIAQGKTHVAIDKDVLNEFYTDFDTPVVQAPIQVQEQVQAQAPVQSQPVITPAQVIEELPAVTPPVKVVEQTSEVMEPPVTYKKVEPSAPEVTAPTVKESTPAPVSSPYKAPSFDDEKPKAPTTPLANVSHLSLDELRLQGNSCSSCKLNIGEKRSKNTGLNAQARLMIITEPSGTGIDFISDPFHGDAGNLLIKMISAMNIQMDDVYLCMAHRCFGPGARETIGQTKPYLERQIKLVNPEVIVIFGGAALNILLNEQSLVKCRGRWLEIGNVPAIATFPPGYLLKKAGAKKEAWNDLQQVMARLNL
jgi:DNA polymerase